MQRSSNCQNAVIRLIKMSEPATSATPPKMTAARADAIDQRAGDDAERQSGEKKAEEKSLSELGASEVKILDEVRVECGKAVEDDADDEKEIEEGGEDDPPAVIGFAACVCAAGSQSYFVPWRLIGSDLAGELVTGSEA